jgi:hypothetical protein
VVVKARTLNQLHEFLDPLVVPVRVPFAARDENRMQVVGQVFWAWQLAALGLDNVLHHRLDTKLGIMVVAGFEKQLVEDFAERANFFLCVWVWFVCF